MQQISFQRYLEALDTARRGFLIQIVNAAEKRIPPEVLFTDRLFMDYLRANIMLLLGFSEHPESRMVRRNNKLIMDTADSMLVNVPTRALVSIAIAFVERTPVNEGETPDLGIFHSMYGIDPDSRKSLLDEQRETQLQEGIDRMLRSAAESPTKMKN